MSALLHSAACFHHHATALSQMRPSFSRTEERKVTLHQLPLPSRSSNLRTGAKGFGAAVTDKKNNSEEQRDGGAKGGGSRDDEEIPQEVFNRIVKRILFYVGAPMATGVGLLFILGALKEQHVWDVPKWLPFVTTLFSFGTSALGIAYGTLSTSWDLEKEGSLLGWEEAKQNWPELWKGDEGGR